MRKFGRTVLVGDLVIRKEQAHLIDNIVDEVPEDLEDEEPEVEEAVKEQRNHKDLVIEVTAENISEFQFSDVVMPLIGYDVRLPANEELQ